MPKLNQIIAVVSGKKTRTQQLLTETHRGWNKEAIAGVIRRYTPRDEAGEKLPPESKNVQLHVGTKISEIQRNLIDFWDVVATQECGNTGAVADIVDDAGTIVLAAVPVTVLLFLEKQLEDLRTFLVNLPTLPPDRTWTWDANRNCYATDTVETARSQKVPEVIVKYHATAEHPAQTELFAKDVTVGTWATTYLSSAIPSEKQQRMIARLNNLSEAVKRAREEANSREVSQFKIGQEIIGYVFND